MPRRRKDKKHKAHDDAESTGEDAAGLSRRKKGKQKEVILDVDEEEDLEELEVIEGVEADNNKEPGCVRRILMSITLKGFLIWPLPRKT